MGGDNKRSQKDLQAVGDLLQSLLQKSKSPLSDQFLRWKLWRSWPDVVGPQIAKSTLPVSFLQGELYVWVNHPARMQELTFCAGELLKKVNAFGGRRWIRRIRFTLDRKSVPSLEESDAGLREFLSKGSPSEGGEPQPGR
jgi:hypothetical protein